MIQIIRVFVLCLLALTAFGQRDVDLPKIEIQENRLNVPFSETTRSMEIMTKNEIQFSTAENLAELLQYIGGVDIRRRGPNGVQADINFRGSTFEQVLVLINGVKVIDPQTGHHVLNIPLDMDIIERIEIVKGPAGRIYGQGAFAGAINIVTKLPKKSQAYGEAMLGQFGLFRGKVGGNYKAKKSNTYASYSYEQADPGYRENAYYNRHNLFIQSDFEIKDVDMKFVGSYVDNSFGANSFYAAPFDLNSFEEVQTGFASLQSKHKIGKTNILPSIYYRNNRDHYVLVKSDPSIYENNHTTQVAGINVNANTMIGKKGVLGYGIEYRNEDIVSNILGDRNRDVFTGNLEYKLYLLKDKLKITPGVSFNSYSDFGFNYLWGVDFSIALTKKFNFFGNVGTTYRIPSYTELYYEDRSNVGNADLTPEEAFNYEAGIKYLSKGLFFQASYFKRDGQNIIDWIDTEFVINDSTTVNKWRPDNVTELPIEGVDVTAVWNIRNFISPLKKVRLSYTYVDASAIQVPNEISRYALENIRHQINAVAYISLLNTVKFTTGYRYVDRVTVDPYHVWDFSVGIKYKGFYMDFMINNAFDQEFEEYPGIPMPQSWARTSLRYTIK